jgi:RNA 2',3'-cyclic 3'-phosphodiesterase
VTGTTRRLFIGLMPDEAVRAALVEHQRHWHWGGGRPTPRSRLHLTLHFLGEVDPIRELALRDALAGEMVAPFDLNLRTPQAWANGIAVLRPDEQVALRDLHARLAARLVLAGLAPMRGPWVPHVTLARHAPAAAPPEAPAPVSWTVEDFSLVWSRPGPPAHYEVLDRYGVI